MSRQPKTKVAWAASLALTQGRSTFPSDWCFSLEIQMRLFLLVIWELFYHIEWWYQFFFNLWPIEERFHEIVFFLPSPPPAPNQATSCQWVSLENVAARHANYAAECLHLPGFWCLLWGKFLVFSLGSLTVTVCFLDTEVVTMTLTLE